MKTAITPPSRRGFSHKTGSSLSIKALRGTVTTLVLFISACFTGCSSTTPVRTFTGESQANSLLRILRQFEIDASKRSPNENNQGWTIEVPASDFNMALELMDDFCIGSEPADVTDEGAFNKSPELEKSISETKRKLEIEENLRALPSVRCVNVALNFPEGRSLSVRPYPAQAAVIVQYVGAHPPVNSDQIADQVSRSVPDLAVENVKVTLIKRPTRYDPDEFQRLTEERGKRSARRWLIVGAVSLTFILLLTLFAAVIRQMKTAATEDYVEYEDTESDPSELLRKE